MKKTSNAIKADKTTTPLTPKTKKILDTKVITKPANWNMPKRAPLRKEKKPKSSFRSTTTDQDQEVMRSYQTNDQETVPACRDGSWAKPTTSDKQPLSGPGKYMTVRDLGIMPDEALGLQDRLPSAQIPVKKKTRISPIQFGEWTHQYDKG